MNIIQFNLRVVMMCLCLSLSWSMGAFAIDAGDDFNDNSKDPTKWGADQTAGFGVLTERNQRLEYTCAGISLNDISYRPWIFSQFPYNADWEIQVDTANLSAPIPPFQVNSMGIQIFSPLMAGTGLYTELYSSALGGPARNGFSSALEEGGSTVAGADSGGLGVTNGAVRLTFTSATKILSVFYDVDVSDGYQWVKYGTFGIAGSGGSNGNSNWGLIDTDQITAFVYGFSAGMTVASGQIHGDNFNSTGGVPSAGVPPTIIPTGIFGFGFPVNNPLLTPIVSIAGNYHGTVTSDVTRKYNIDVAQDGAGRLSYMGTMDGVQGSNGNSVIGGNLGAVQTVNGKPTAQLNGSFNGTRDGLNVSATGTATGPLELVDLGGGTKGAVGTGSYSSDIGGMHFSGNNLPIRITAPPGSEDNLRKSWSVELNIRKKHEREHGRQLVLVSAHLKLPNGEIIEFGEKTANYNDRRGYSLSFKNGMNMAFNPPKKDKNSSIAIDNLIFAPNGALWKPAGGVITYEFLGQKGSANILDFVGPANTPSVSENGSAR